MKTTMKFRKKPVVIEAYQTDVERVIETLEGAMKANVGDWIITGVNGEQYPCKPDIFEKTYERVDDMEPVKRMKSQFFDLPKKKSAEKSILKQKDVGGLADKVINKVLTDLKSKKPEK